MATVKQLSKRRVVSLALAELPDDDVILRAIQEDEAAFGELYRRYARDIRAFCRRLINDPSRLDDLTQETFTRALNHMHRFRHGERLWPWLSTIARNVCIDALRAPHPRPSSSLGFESEQEEPPPRILFDSTADEVVRLDERARARKELSRAFSKLAPRDRRILWLHTVEEWTYDDIARADQSTVHAVRNIAWRARNLIRSMMEDGLSLPAFIPGLLLGAKHVRDRFRGRMTRMASRLGYAPGSEQLAERGVALFASVGIVLALSGVLHGGGAHPRQPRPMTPTAAESSAIRPTQRPTSPSSSEPRAAHLLRATATPPIPVAADSDVNKNEHAAAPASATFHIEVRDPQGNTLFADDDDFSCGGDNPSKVLPQDGPVQAWC